MNTPLDDAQSDTTETVTPQTTVEVDHIEIPILHVTMIDWQTCDEIATPHTHTYDDDGNSICKG